MFEGYRFTHTSRNNRPSQGRAWSERNKEGNKEKEKKLRIQGSIEKVRQARNKKERKKEKKKNEYRDDRSSQKTGSHMDRQTGRTRQKQADITKRTEKGHHYRQVSRQTDRLTGRQID